MNTQEDVFAQKLQHFSEIIIKQLKFHSYHFIELYIYFSNFIENEVIEQDSFITANTTLLNPEEEDEEEVQGFSQDIFETISYNNTTANIPSLCAYLKKISISTAVEFDIDILFAILDKDNKGHVDYSDIQILTGSIEDFIEESNDWNQFELMLSNVKIVKKHLNKTFLALFKKILKQANDKIQNLIDNAKQQPKSNNTINKNNHSHSHSNNNSKGENNNQMTIYTKRHQYNNDIPQPQNEHEPIDEILFDRGKIDIIKKIRKLTYLYDIDYDEILLELCIYENHIFDKEQFISIMCSFICKKTSDLLLSPMMKLAFSMLFQMMDVEHRNKLSYYEVLGGIIPLTKNSNRIDKMKMLSKYPKKKIYLFLSGGFALYLNTTKIKDLVVFSEIVYNEWLEAGIKCNKDLLNWIFGQGQEQGQGEPSTVDSNGKYKETPQDKNYDYRSNSIKISVTPSPSDISSIIDGIREKYMFMKSKAPQAISILSIIDITNFILKYSFLGVINAFQISTLLDALINEKYNSLPVKSKNRLKAECMAGIERNFDFTQSELIDTTYIHAFGMLIFSGTTIEKFQSIFLIYDLGENEAIDYDDLSNYLTNLFTFIMKRTTIDWCNPKTLSKIICDYIMKSVDKKITLTCLMQAFDSLNLTTSSSMSNKA